MSVQTNYQIDMREAVNVVSEVVQNRPKPIRAFDQIYMKTGDMVMQSEIIAHWSDGKKLAFIGDGDAVSVCVAYLMKREILEYGPTKITVFDFDERIVNAVKRFAEQNQLRTLDAVLYNCVDEFPEVAGYDYFYTNPPWGASNDGNSVNVFAQRGFEAVGHRGQGLVVIADDTELSWPKHVLARIQEYGRGQGYFVSRMQSRMHEYHLDDDGELRSCNLFLEALPNNQPFEVSKSLNSEEQISNFYGSDNDLRVQYVRQGTVADPSREAGENYRFEFIGDEK